MIVYVDPSRFKVAGPEGPAVIEPVFGEVWWGGLYGVNDGQVVVGISGNPDTGTNYERFRNVTGNKLFPCRKLDLNFTGAEASVNPTTGAKTTPDFVDTVEKYYALITPRYILKYEGGYVYVAYAGTSTEVDIVKIPLTNPATRYWVCRTPREPVGYAETTEYAAGMSMVGNTLLMACTTGIYSYDITDYIGTNLYGEWIELENSVPRFWNTNDDSPFPGNPSYDITIPDLAVSDYGYRVGLIVSDETHFYTCGYHQQDYWTQHYPGADYIETHWKPIIRKYKRENDGSVSVDTGGYDGYPLHQMGATGMYYTAGNGDNGSPSDVSEQGDRNWFCQYHLMSSNNKFLATWVEWSDFWNRDSRIEIYSAGDNTEYGLLESVKPGFDMGWNHPDGDQKSGLGECFSLFWQGNILYVGWELKCPKDGLYGYKRAFVKYEIDPITKNLSLQSHHMVADFDVIDGVVHQVYPTTAYGQYFAVKACGFSPYETDWQYFDIAEGEIEHHFHSGHTRMFAGQRIGYKMNDPVIVNPQWDLIP